MRDGVINISVMKKIIKKIKNDCIYILVRFLLVVFRILPIFIIEKIIGCIGCLFSILPIKENNIAIQNLRNYYPEEESKKIYKQMYGHFETSIVEMIRIIIKGEDISEFSYLNEDSANVLKEALSKNKGVIYFTGHIGNWEIMAITLAKYGFDINTIARESYDSRFTLMIKNIRESNGVKCIFRNEENIKEKILQVLNRNGVMGFLIDQNTSVLSQDVEFLNRIAPTPVVPVKILKGLGCEAVVGYNYRENSKLITEIKRLDYTADEDDIVILRRINEIISEHIKKYPHQWIWVHDRWKISG